MYVAQSNIGRLTHITEAYRGLACLCTCVVCGEAVIAKQGAQLEWHFAHRSNREPCEISPESMLHRFVKQSIEDAGGIKLPPVPPERLLTPSLVAATKQGWLKLDRMTCEVALGAVRPDVVGYCGDEPFIIEVAYTSFCDAEKIRAIETLGLCALEIDVSGFHPTNFDPDAVRHAVLTDDSIRAWLVTKPSVTVGGAAVPASSPLKIKEHMSAIIAGRLVRLRVLHWGQLALSYDYGDEVCTLVRSIAHRCSGRWDDRYKNWRINACWLPEVEAMLKLHHDPSSLR